MYIRWIVTTLWLAVISGTLAAEPDSPVSEWITLGTIAGPIPHPVRSQPANAILVGNDVYLIDAGDGTAGRLATAGISLDSVRAVFISHLHFDHTGGLPAILGLRWQTRASENLVVYGPPGTRRMVEGIVEYMGPGAEGSYGIPGSTAPPADHNLEVVEIHDGSTVELQDFTLTAVRNTHYSWPEGTDEWKRFQSLSFKFELPERTIVYTGDTGPSSAVEKLASGADLLVTEMMDLAALLALIRRAAPDMPPPQFEGLKKHLSSHHVTPEQVGDMASRANVGRIVVTHLGPGVLEPSLLKELRKRVQARFRGDVVIASDLDRF